MAFRVTGAFMGLVTLAEAHHAAFLTLGNCKTSYAIAIANAACTQYATLHFRHSVHACPDTSLLTVFLIFCSSTWVPNQKISLRYELELLNSLSITVSLSFTDELSLLIGSVNEK